MFGDVLNFGIGISLTFTGNTIYDPSSLLTIFNLTNAQTTSAYNYDQNS
jgi:hypothetical protein